jgi:gliding motility-associated-like protein
MFSKSFTLFFFFFCCLISNFSQVASKPCDVGKDLYICSESTLLKSLSVKPGKWSQLLGFSSNIVNENNPIASVSNLTFGKYQFKWEDNECADTINVFFPRIGNTTSSLIGNGSEKLDELILCNGSSWQANTQVINGPSFVAYALYISSPPIKPNVFLDIQAAKGPLIFANNDLNNGQLISMLPNSLNQQFYFVPILYHEFNSNGPIIDSICQVTSNPIKITYLKAITVDEKKDCYKGENKILIKGGSAELFGGSYKIKNILPAIIQIEDTVIPFGTEFTMSNIPIGTQYSFDIEDSLGCLTKIVGTIPRCISCKTDVEYRDVYCITDQDQFPILKNGNGIGVIDVSPSGLMIDSITGKIFISKSKPGVYSLTNTSSPSCQVQKQSKFSIELKDTIPIPIGPMIDTICLTNPKVGDIKGISAQLITWYNKDGKVLDPLNDPAIHNQFYYCTQTIKGCESRKYAVKVMAPIVSPPIGKDTQYVCNNVPNQTIERLKPNGKNIHWYTESGKLLKSSDPLIVGKYFVSQTIVCESKSKIKVIVNQDTSVLPATILPSFDFCENNISVDSVLNFCSNCKWYDLPNSKSSLSKSAMLEQGTYYVSYFNNQTNCETTKQKVRIFIRKLNVTLSIDYPSCTSSDGSVSAKVIGGKSPYTYNWSNSLSNSSITNVGSGNYALKVTESSSKKCVFDTLIEIVCKPILIPQILTIDGNSKNDRWVIDYYTKYPNVQVSIYNRWGKLVFISKTPYMDDWDGKMINENSASGNYLPTGTYYYCIDKGNGDKLETGYLEIIN